MIWFDQLKAVDDNNSYQNERGWMKLTQYYDGNDEQHDQGKILPNFRKGN